jgi:hypothetical protein
MGVYKWGQIEMERTKNWLLIESLNHVNHGVEAPLAGELEAMCGELCVVSREHDSQVGMWSEYLEEMKGGLVYICKGVDFLCTCEVGNEGLVNGFCLVYQMFPRQIITQIFLCNVLNPRIYFTWRWFKNMKEDSHHRPLQY